MIDKKKLIDEVDYYISHTREKSGEHYAYKKAKELIERQPKVGEWIPVSERLPDKDDVLNVLVTYYDSLTQCTSTDIEGWFRGSWMKTLDFNEHRIAWQPLPEPYRKDVE